MKPATVTTDQTRASRSPALDIAKGIGILLVVLGHNPWVVEARTLSDVVFSFHVPLFIFLSGVFFQPAQPFSRLATSRADALLKPYFVMLALLTLLDIVARGRGIEERLSSMLYGTGGTMTWIPLWFLPYLWLVTMVCWVIWHAARVERAGAIRRTLLFALVLALAVWCIRWSAGSDALVLGKVVAEAGLPWSLDLALIGAFFFLAGRLSRGALLSLRHRPWLAAVVLLSFVLLFQATGASMDLNMRRYDSYVWSTALAFLGIALTLLVSAALARHAWPLRILAYVGQATLIILIFHSIPQAKMYAILERNMPEADGLNAVLAFAVGVGLPLMIYAAVARTPWLATLMLPRRSPEVKSQ